VLSDRGKSGDREEGGEVELHYPLWYVIDTWLAYRNHGLLPSEGTYNDQDPKLVSHDWGEMNRRYSELAAQLKDDNTDNPLPLPKHADDWMNLS
jgi:hypothetical protein